jgi:hypothetical protein
MRYERINYDLADVVTSTSRQRGSESGSVPVVRVTCRSTRKNSGKNNVILCN